MLAITPLCFSLFSLVWHQAINDILIAVPPAAKTNFESQFRHLRRLAKVAFFHINREKKTLTCKIDICVLNFTKEKKQLETKLFSEKVVCHCCMHRAKRNFFFRLKLAERLTLKQQGKNRRKRKFLLSQGLFTPLGGRKAGRKERA